MNKNSFVLVAGLLSFCFSYGSAARADVVRLSEDFFVSRAPAAWGPRKAPALRAVNDPRALCEASLRAAVCETDADQLSITSNFDSVSCAADSAKYVPALLDIYEETPEPMRASLCSLDHIYISDAIASTAFASAISDANGNMIGGLVGFRKATFLQQPSSRDLVTWKEQLAFGGSSEFLSNDPSLVQISYDLKMSHLKADGLFYVLMHELGHLIDFNNGINSRFASTGWTKLSWGGFGQPLASAKYEFQEDFCFYNCSSFLEASQAKTIYPSLAKSAFLTSYSGMNRYEDFAEFWVWHLMIAYKNPSYVINVPGELKVEMNRSFTENPQIKNKLSFVERLWSSASIRIDNHAGAVVNPPN